jgi:hypothetical protein
MYYESSNTSRLTEAGKKKAKEAGAVDLLPRGDALEELVPMLRQHAEKAERKKATVKLLRVGRLHVKDPVSRWRIHGLQEM